MSGLTGVILACVAAATPIDPVDCGGNSIWSTKSNPGVFQSLQVCKDETNNFIKVLMNRQTRTKIGIPPEANVLFFRCVDEDTKEVTYDSLYQGTDVTPNDQGFDLNNPMLRNALPTPKEGLEPCSSCHEPDGQLKR